MKLDDDRRDRGQSNAAQAVRDATNRQILARLRKGAVRRDKFTFTPETKVERARIEQLLAVFVKEMETLSEVTWEKEGDDYIVTIS